MAEVLFGGRVSVTGTSLMCKPSHSSVKSPHGPVLRHVALAEPKDYAPGHFLALNHEHHTIVFAIRGWSMSSLITVHSMSPFSIDGRKDDADGNRRFHKSSNMMHLPKKLR